MSNLFNFNHPKCDTSLLLASLEEAKKFKCDVCGKSFSTGLQS